VTIGGHAAARPTETLEPQQERSPVLSVAIPTYNRGETLRRQLGSLLGQILGCQADVEIVVSDNASSDGTASVVAELGKRFPEVRYVRNEANLGANRNIDAAVRACRAEYVWILSDDDVLMPFAVETVVAAVLGARRESDRPSFILLSAFPLAHDNAWIGPAWTPLLGPSGFVPYARNVFLAADYSDIGMISRYVVRRLDWAAAPFVMDGPWVGYGHIKQLLRVAKNRPAYLDDKPIVGLRQMPSKAYANHVPMSFFIEFPSYDALLLNEWNVPRDEIAHLQRRRQRRRLKMTLRALVKVNLFTEYEPYWPLVDGAMLLTFEGRAARFGARLFLRNRPWSGRLRRYFEPRLLQPVSSDAGLHQLL
jgi:glycosyltransferase involved in cell wall biosynthesis